MDGQQLRAAADNSTSKPASTSDKVQHSTILTSIQSKRDASSLPDSSKSDVAIAVKDSSSSLFDLHSHRMRWLVLLAVALAALLVPFTDAIYLPAMPAVGHHLGASKAAVAATVSVFLFAVAVGNTFWGPFSDRYGRRLTYNLSTLMFLGTTLGCTFSPNIQVLILMRALQGFAQCSFLTTGQAVIADVFQPVIRGAALGLFMQAVLVGPVIGPLVGGALSAAFGWRSTFLLLATLCGLLGALLFAFLPETHHFFALKRLSEKDPAHAASIPEASRVLAAEPRFQPPWAVLSYLISPVYAPYVLANAWSHACLFACLSLWPVFMAAAPHNLNESAIGVTFLANGVGSIVGSFVGGSASDRAAKRFAHAPEGRVVYSLAITSLSMPGGLLLLGFGLHAHLHIAVLLAASCCVGFGLSSLLPGVYSFVSCVDQAHAGCATAALNTAWCSLAGLMVLLSVPGVGALGVGGYLSLLAGIHMLCVAVAAVCTVQRLRA